MAMLGQIVRFPWVKAFCGSKPSVGVAAADWLACNNASLFQTGIYFVHEERGPFEVKKRER